MNAVIICSVHALCDISQLEREACNRACELHSVPANLTVQDHARLISTTTMLGFLNHLPGSKEQRDCLIASYLEILNDEIWAASLMPYKSVSSAFLGQKRFAWPKGFVSDYPLLTTNMVRSAALLTNATKLGHLTALSDPKHIETTADGLAACATSLEVAHDETEVLVAHRRDFIAAQSIGMSPRFIEGLRSEEHTRNENYMPRAQIPAGPAKTAAPTSPAIAVSA